jgi:capsular exopolysaccharide synthesis family protein
MVDRCGDAEAWTEEQALGMNEYLSALRKRWWVIAVLAAVGAGIGYYDTQSATPMYRASSEMYVSLTRGDTVGELVQGSTYTRGLVESFVQLATTPKVLDPVVDDLGLNVSSRALAGAVSADSPLNTVIIKVTAVSTNPDRAAAIANSVATHLSETVVELSPTSAEGAATVTMNVVSPAVAPLHPFSPNKKLDVATGLALGLALGFVIALVVSRLDTRVRTIKDIPTEPERAMLGVVPLDRSIRRHGGRAILEVPHSPLAESYRRVRTNLQFLNLATPLRVVVVSSAVPDEGKTMTSINLALTMAEQGKRVLLVDADMRRASVAAECGLEESAGLSTVLVGEATLEDVAQVWAAPTLRVVTAGTAPPNPGQLIESEAMSAFLHRARELYDFVVVDAPPLLAVTDAAVLAHRTDGVIVVAGSSKVRRHELDEALASLDAIEATVLGIVLNKVRRSRSDGYAYSYGSAGKKKPRPARRKRSAPLPVPVVPDPTAAPPPAVTWKRLSPEPGAHVAEPVVEQDTHEPPAPREPLDIPSEVTVPRVSGDGAPGDGAPRPSTLRDRKSTR